MNAYVVYIRQYCVRNGTAVAKFISTNILSRSQCCWDFKSIQYMQSSVLARVLFSLFLLYVDVPNSMRSLANTFDMWNWIRMAKENPKYRHTNVNPFHVQERAAPSYACNQNIQESLQQQRVSDAYERASQPTEWCMYVRESEWSKAEIGWIWVAAVCFVPIFFSTSADFELSGTRNHAVRLNEIKPYFT